MILNKKDNVLFYTFETFSKTGMVKHCFSTRKGGVSSGVFSEMNLGFHRGDCSEHIIQNFEILTSAIQSQAENVVFANQIHQDNVYIVSQKDKEKVFHESERIKDTDAFITNEQNVLLTTYHADCVPIYLVDPVKKAIGLAHAGWRGTALQIGKKTALAMKNVYGCAVEDILVGIGPSIGGCCFEVDLPVVTEFKNLVPFCEKYISDCQNGKYKINLWGINQQSLEEVGIKTSNIEVAEICTMCDTELFFSHRAMGGERGSLVAMLELM